MLTKADDYPVHQTPEPIAYAGTDRNFYDRFFFNGLSADGSVFFAVAHYDAHWSDVVRVVVALSITLALTLLSWFLMERPLMRWSKKLSARDEARRAAAGGAAGGPPEPAVGTG